MSSSENKERRRLEAVGETPPLYQLLERKLRHRIEAGQWKPGMMIPGRLRLSEEYAVNIRTVERALKALIDEGILETQGTRGTFVALNPHPAQSVSAPSSASVEEAAPQISRHVSSGLRSGQKLMPIVGIMTSDNPLSRDVETIVKSIEKTFSVEGGSVLFYDRILQDARLMPGRGKIAPLNVAIDALRAQGCRAIVSIDYNAPEPQIEEANALAKQASLPIVHVLSAKVDRPVWSVYYDSFDAGYQAAQHLIDKECADYLFLGSLHFSWAEERLAGLRTALRHAGISEKCLRVKFIDQDDQDDPGFIKGAGRVALAAFAGGIPAGIIAVNDNVALGVIEAAKRSGLVAGRDFLLVGFDDTPEARSSHLTTMRPPLEELGHTAAGLARRAISGDRTRQQVCLSSHLLVRLSSMNALEMAEARSDTSHLRLTAASL